MTFRSLLVLTLLAVGASRAHAIEDSDCGSDEVGLVRTYLSIDNAAPGDTRATNGRIRLRGWVYIPPGTAPTGGFPVIVFNHGSNEDTGPRCTLADYFTVKKKYILFVPVRRGHIGSTGEYVGDYAERKANETCGAAGCTAEMREFWRKYWIVEYLRDQRADVVAALAHIKGYPKANRAKVAVMGHSYGGIVSVFWNTLTDDTKAFVNVSGGAQSWEGSPYLRDEMKKAVRNAQRPIFFLQPKNDASIKPTVELSYVAGLEAQRYQAAIFAPVPQALIQPCPRPSADDPSETDSCGDVAHGKFVRASSEIAKWGPTVVDFLRRIGVR